MQTNKFILPSVAVVVLAIAAIAVYANREDETAGNVSVTATPTSAATAASSTPSATSTATSSTSKYKDGSYTSSGTYVSPGGSRSVTVTLTLANDVVVASQVTGSGDDATTRQFQDDFIESHKTFVVGKNIDTLSLAKVSGSSLTSKGFNAALAQIKTQSQV